MTTGEFSRRSQLSLKALRLYERLGLLRPAAVDPGNGFRRYHESQLYAARLIIMLRQLDMPLSEVGKVVSASGTEAAALIDAYWDSAERRFTAQQQLMAGLRPSVAVSRMPAPELPVQGRDVAEQAVLTEQRHVYAGQLAWIREAAPRRRPVRISVNELSGVQPVHAPRRIFTSCENRRRNSASSPSSGRTTFSATGRPAGVSAR